MLIFKPSRRLRVLAAAVCFLAGASLRGQTISGSINGAVTDQSGAIVSGAQITVTSQTTGLRRTAVTSNTGEYTLPLLPPGAYDVQIDKQGFARAVRRSVQLQVNQGITLNFTLALSNVSASVEVTGAPPALETTSATIGKVIPHDQVVDLPLNGRSFTQLVLLTPGASPVEATQQSVFIVAQGSAAVSPSVNGQRGQQDNYTMDGVLNNSLYVNNWAISPPPDAIQEFNVQSHIVDAEFSISSGANVNLLTRSGTDRFSGSLWEFFRNTALNSRNFFDPAQTAPYKQNQYGFYLGGPVLLPGVRRGHNTWFSVYWEGFRSRLDATRLTNVPTQAMRQGDFSGVGSAIYDPATSVASGPGVTRSPFPNNIIPSSRLNPAALTYLSQYYPLPNLNIGTFILPNHQFGAVDNTDSDQVGIRIDRRLGDKDTLFGRFNRTNVTETTPQAVPTDPQLLVNYARSAAVGYTHLFSPTVLLSLHYGYTETNDLRANPPVGEQFLSSTGLDRISPVRDGVALAPAVTITNGYPAIGAVYLPLGPQQNHDGHADLTVVRGRHTLSAGLLIYRVDTFDDRLTTTIAFTQNATSKTGTTTSTGFGPASMVLGLPTTVNGSGGDTSANFTTNWYGGYIQDKWQVASRLTLQFGLRYDYVSPPSYMNNKVSGLDVDTGQFLIPVAYPPLFPAATVRSSYFDPKYNGWQPRFGAAYRATSRIVARGAFAMFDDHNNNLVQEEQNLRTAWPWAFAISLAQQNEGLALTTFDHLPLASSFTSPNFPTVSGAVNPRNDIPYAIEYNGGLQAQLAPSLVLSTDYVGSVGRHLFITPTANVAVIPGPGSVMSRGQPFTAYSRGSFQYSENAGTSSYNAFQVKLEKSLSAGLTFLASYTWSKSLDLESDAQANSFETIYDLRRDWGPSSFDRRHMFVWSGTYSLPLGAHRRFLKRSVGLVQAALGDWNIGSITTFISGAPFDIVAGGDAANVGGGTQRAQVVGDPGSGFTQSRLEWFNKAAFAAPAAYTFGNEGRNNLPGPAHFDTDFIAFKNFTLRENIKLQLRGEFFNFFNHTNFGLPGANVAAPAILGLISSAGSPRLIQLALKLTF